MIGITDLREICTYKFSIEHKFWRNIDTSRKKKDVVI